MEENCHILFGESEESSNTFFGESEESSNNFFGESEHRGNILLGDSEESWGNCLAEVKEVAETVEKVVIGCKKLFIRSEETAEIAQRREEIRAGAILLIETEGRSRKCGE